MNVFSLYSQDSATVWFETDSLSKHSGSTVKSGNLCEHSQGKLTCFSLKEVIQPQVPLRLPCYDFTPVIDHTVDGVLLAVRLPASGAANSHGVTGGVYKARERIHRSILICDY